MKLKYISGTEKQDFSTFNGIEFIQTNIDTLFEIGSSTKTGGIINKINIREKP